jgi:D-alanyl-lipoteichoic acid acyltransferase DltB (MBOAT superfamily)
MLFNTPQFVVAFLPVVLAGSLALDRWAGRRAALACVLAASLLFYAWWQPPVVILLIGSIVVNYGVGLKIRSGGARLGWLRAGVGFNLGLLGFFKYAVLLLSCVGASAKLTPLLPLGISFFSFQQIMYLVDTYRAEIDSAPFLEYACFIAFFPHLIAGPIVRPGHIIPQFLNFAPSWAWQDRLAAGAEIFLLGLAKKLVLADGLARFANPGFAAAAQGAPITLIEAWVALLAYALQIYFDFSGYSDMAIGLARMFGVGFPLNFHSPYKAANISEFWRRWNITLSGFLRDYLYIPLGGNRRGETRRIFNLMVTMLLGGLWHGAALRFALWGALHGVYLIIHGWSSRMGLRLPRLLAWGLTLLCVLLAWVPFRAPSFAAALTFYRGLFGVNGFVLPKIVLLLFPGAGSFAPIVPVLPYLGEARAFSLPQGLVFLTFGWFIALGLPQLHDMKPSARSFALATSLAMTTQALFFAPYAIPFLYYQF